MTIIIDGPDPFDLAGWRDHLEELMSAPQDLPGRAEAIAEAEATIAELSGPALDAPTRDQLLRDVVAQIREIPEIG